MSTSHHDQDHERLAQKLSELNYPAPSAELRHRTLRATRLALEPGTSSSTRRSWWLEGLLATAVALLVAWPQASGPITSDIEIDPRLDEGRLQELREATGTGTLGYFAGAANRRQNLDDGPVSRWKLNENDTF